MILVTLKFVVIAADGNNRKVWKRGRPDVTAGFDFKF